MTSGGHIQIGRIVLINFGPSYGKIGVIMDIIDGNRCLVDGPSGRQVINFKRITPSRFKFPIDRKINTKKLHKIFVGKKIEKKWAKSMWGEKIFRTKQKKSLSDFENFKFMIGKKYKSNILQLKFRKE